MQPPMIYLLTQGSFGLLRADGWIDGRITFTGAMTMIGIEASGA